MADSAPIGQRNEDLGTSAVRGVFWTGSGQVIRQVIGIVTSVILARLLVPDDFGLLGMAMVFIALSQLFTDFGIGSAIVQRKEVDRLCLSSAFWANIVVAASAAAILAAASPWVAEFYGDPRVSAVLLVLAFTLVFSGAAVVPNALLYRAMSFDRVVKSQIAGSVCGAAIALALAYSGAGVWSLVAQPVVGGFVMVAVLWRFTRWIPDVRFSWNSIRGMAIFSGGVLGSSLLNYGNRNADKLFIGKFLGSGPLGYYSLAYQIMLYPLEHVASVIVKVLFPALSRMQGEPGRFRRTYVKSVSAIAFFTFPMMLGLHAVTEDFVLVVFGTKWLEMVPILKVFCFIGMLQSVTTTVGTIYLSTGRTGVMFKLMLVVTPFYIGAFWIGLRWGAVGVAVAYLIMVLVFSQLNLHIALRAGGLRLRDVYSGLFRPVLVSVLMYGAVYGLSHFLPQGDGWPASARLLVLVIAGVSVYTCLTLLLNRTQFNELRSFAARAASSA